MRKPLRDMKTVRDRIGRTLDDYSADNEGTIACALDAAQPVLDDARADLAEEKARNGELIAEMQRTRTAADYARGETKRLAEQRVRELHRPDENGECTACDESFEPCSTIRALDGEEADRA